MKCRHKATVGRSYTVLYHNLSTRSRENMATEINKKTNRNQISSFSSIFCDIKTMLDDFRQGLPDYIEKIISKKLDEQDALSLHTNPINIDEDSASNRVNNNEDTDTPVPNNRDKSSHNTDVDQGSAIGGVPQKDRDSSIGELSRNRKRHGSKDDNEPPLKMSREILRQVDNDLGIYNRLRTWLSITLSWKNWPCILLSHQQIILNCKNNERKSNPSNLTAIKPPKLDPEIESCHQFQNNTSFVMSNEKSLYTCQNFIVKATTIMSDISNSVLLASDNDTSGGPINHVNIVKACMNRIILLGHLSA